MNILSPDTVANKYRSKHQRFQYTPIHYFSLQRFSAVEGKFYIWLGKIIQGEQNLLFKIPIPGIPTAWVFKRNYNVILHHKEMRCFRPELSKYMRHDRKQLNSIFKKQMLIRLSQRFFCKNSYMHHDRKPFLVSVSSRNKLSKLLFQEQVSFGYCFQLMLTQGKYGKTFKEGPRLVKAWDCLNLMPTDYFQPLAPLPSPPPFNFPIMNESVEYLLSLWRTVWWIRLCHVTNKLY